jgi:thiol-disulfide isomerase/thioredoxin
MSDHKFNNTKVLNLEPSDFSGKTLTVKGQKMRGIALVFVWASYCGHCINSVPTVSTLASSFNKNILDHNSITIMAVQGDSKDQSDKDTLAKLQNLTRIQGYPTILIFKNGEFLHVYNGDRSLDTIKSYLTRL